MTRYRTRWIAGAVGVVVVAFGVVLAVNPESPGPEHANISGKEVANVSSLTTLDGARFTFASLRGRAVIVNFWNTWCIPCKREEPTLAAFYSRHRSERDFAMVGIVRDDEAGAVRDYAPRHGIDWTIVLDPKSKAALTFGTTGQPETYAIAPDGRVTLWKASPVTTGDLEIMLASARGR